MLAAQDCGLEGGRKSIAAEDAQRIFIISINTTFASAGRGWWNVGVWIGEHGSEACD